MIFRSNSGSGLVPLRDIESRWARQTNTQVIDHLRAVADQSQSQLLSFDRYALIHSFIYLFFFFMFDPNESNVQLICLLFFFLVFF